MSRFTSKPGPFPVSCITCRRRRKKCDLGRPCCERCLKGGFECLGYEADKLRASVRTETLGLRTPSQPTSTPPATPVEEARSDVLDPLSAGSPEDRQNPIDTDSHMDHNTRPSLPGAAVLRGMNQPFISVTDDRTPTNPLEDFDCPSPQEKSQITVYSPPPVRRPSCPRRPFYTASGVRPTGDDLSRAFRTLCRSIPPSVDAKQMMREDHFARVIEDYFLQRASCWFTVPSPAIRGSLVAQVKGSKRMTWTLYLGAKLFQALVQDPQTCGPKVQGFIGWIDKLEQKFTSDFRSNPPLDDIADRFMVQLELAFLRFSVVNNISGYTLLQKTVPMFLRLVASDSSLYTEHPNGNLVVSFPRTLRAPQHELGRFVLYDTVTALVLGVSPLVEYGYDDEWDSRPHRLEWIHGVPVILLEAISYVNSWRTGSRALLDDWKTLERRVLAWQSSFNISGGECANEHVSEARFAVQEGWRHVVLIYIYMGVCGVSSHDSRVRASVNQILQLAETVADLPIGMHMFFHCVVAGLAARLERHRIFVYNMLLSFKDTRIWLFQGPPFSQVLYHLWLGVGTRGAPVFWNDYVQSRGAVVPI